MKTHKRNLIGFIFSMILVTAMLVTNGTGSVVSATEGGESGWKQYAERYSHFYTSPFEVKADIIYVVGTEVPVINARFSLSFEMIDCCRPSLDPHSWCNYSADDPRCAD